jgi:hypothetical protein
MKREVFYPPIGIAHVTNKLSDLILYKYKNQKKIIINTSAQPNSSPHLGTITTLMTVFALASKIRDDLKVETEVQFDELENSPAETIEYNEEIYYKEGISVRSYNLCKYNNLDTLEKLLDYYIANYTFENLRNCGCKSNEELIEVCKKYQSTYANNTTEQTDKNPLEEILKNLTRIQREVINSFIHVNTNSLSVRSKNAICAFLENNFSVRNFAEKIILVKKFKVEDIENVGKKSIPELEIYISIVKDFIVDVNEANDEKNLIALKNSFLIRQTFSITKIPIEILQSESIFKLTDFLFENNAFFNKNHNSIIQQALKIYNNTEDRTLEEIAIKNNLSRERVRQIRKDCINELSEKLSFIKNCTSSKKLGHFGINP